MKHLEVLRQTYSAVRGIFNPFLGILSGDETQRLLMLDILRHNFTGAFYVLSFIC